MTPRLPKHLRRLLPGLIATFFLPLTGCYGPTTQAKVANAIQTIMANLIEGSFPSLTGGVGGAPVDCSVSGSFVASDATYGTIDPLNPSSTAVNTPIVYSNCVIKVCGETVTIDGPGTSIELTLGDLNGLSGASSNSASIGVIVENQTFSGILSGSLSFSYQMTTTVTGNSLQSIVIDDFSPAAPLSFGGTTYSGSSLAALADGC